MNLERRLIDDCAYFAEQHFIIPETGKAIRLEKWQKRILSKMLVRGRDGKRKHTMALISVPKKNGKSTMLSLIACWHAWTTPNALVVFCANSKEQSKMVSFQKTRYAVEHNPVLKQSAKVYRDRIQIPAINSEIICVQKVAGSVAGLNPSLTCFDELWNYDTQASEELFSELSNVFTREEPLTVITTYAGTSRTSLLYRLYELGKSGKDPQFYFFWSHKNLASWVTPAKLRAKRRQVPDLIYKRLHENRWCSSDEAFIAIEDWQRCHDRNLKPLSPTKEFAVAVGVDAGLREDGSSIVVTYQDPDNEDLVKVGLVSFFKPSGGDLDIEATIGNTLRYLDENYLIESVNFDPKFLIPLSQKMRLPWREISQQRASMCPIYEALIQRVRRRDLAHYGDRELDVQIGNNAIADLTRVGIMLDKKVRSAPVDAVTALALSCWNWETRGSVEITYHSVYTAENPEKVPMPPTRFSWARPHRQQKRGGTTGQRLNDLIQDASR